MKQVRTLKSFMGMASRSYTSTERVPEQVPCSQVLGSLRASRVAMIASVLALLGAGCQTQQPKPQPAIEQVQEAPPPQFLEHTVSQKGETLAAIAQWYTGKSSNWRMIVDLNPGLRPERLSLGQTIMIPQELVVEEKPLPAKFLKKSAGKKSEPKTIEPVTTTEPDFGSIPTAQPVPSESFPPTGTPPLPPPAATSDTFENASSAASEVVKPSETRSVPPAPSFELNDPIAPPPAPPTPPAAEKKPAVQVPTAPPVAPSSADQEREQLLNELLQQ